jgi:hypothetical protein
MTALWHPLILTFSREEKAPVFDRFSNRCFYS